MNAEDGDSTDCKRCHEPMMLRDGCEPTPYCDNCAHALVEEHETEIARLENIVTIQQNQIERLLAARDAETAAKQKLIERAGVLEGEMLRTQRILRDELNRITNAMGKEIDTGGAVPV